MKDFRITWLMAVAALMACKPSEQDEQEPSYAQERGRFDERWCACYEEVGGAAAGAACRKRAEDSAPRVACLEAEARAQAETDGEYDVWSDPFSGASYGTPYEVMTCKAEAYAELNRCTLSCADELFACADGSDVTLQVFVCDGHRDCADGSDEPEGCAPGGHACDDGGWVPLFAVCDGRVDCDDGSDEEGCPETCDLLAKRKRAQCPKVPPEINEALFEMCSDRI